jgi:hypothetical protein
VSNTKEGKVMQVLSLVWGILAFLGMTVGFFPCLGALNWLNIPFSGGGIIIGGIALATAGDKPKGISIAGLLLCIAAFLFGIIRLVAGGGVI